MPILHWPCDISVSGESGRGLDAYWSDDAGAIGADETCFALGFEDVGYADHVWKSKSVVAGLVFWGCDRTVLRYSFCDAV